MIPGEDYKFRDDMSKDFDTVPIELLTENYLGVILRYTNVGVQELANGTAKLKFSYELLEMGKHTETNLRKSKDFETHIGNILNRMILEVVDSDISESEHRESYIEESGEERIVHAKGSAVSQE
jgi:hypothetical protein